MGAVLRTKEEAIAAGFFGGVAGVDATVNKPTEGRRDGGQRRGRETDSSRQGDGLLRGFVGVGKRERGAAVSRRCRHGQQLKRSPWSVDRVGVLHGRVAAWR
ncbi:hypothetical protein ACJRO7_011079 [Eucalyptus globulus]|uniref:Uncharacterized protein n=1 Tax=Eucalyptus globulus TaxID=34317 RepID=A0ABD3LE82_EUCGL